MRIKPFVFFCAILIAGCSNGKANNGNNGGGGGSGGNGGGGGSGGGGGGGGNQGALGYPFGSHGTTYTPGTLMPTGSQTALDNAVAAFYDQWKSMIVPGCSPGTYYINSGGGTVSEGQGYGMVITVIMAGHDPDAQKYYDGLYQYYSQHLSANEPNSHLMSWQLDTTCSVPAGSGNDSATDGDLDIAYSLLLADKQWGSGGKINYLAAAKSIIADIMSFEVYSDTHVTNLGDWNTQGDPHYYGTRPSDFMLDHYRSFKKATGADWTTVIDHTYSLIATLQMNYAKTTGLLPDFVINTNTTPAPAGSNFLEGPNDGFYSYNSCRVPWHLGTDFVLNGEMRAKTALKPINDFILSTTGGDLTKIVDGYKLDGTKIGNAYQMAFVAPFAVGAMAGTNQQWLDSLWSYMSTAAFENAYYDDTLRMLALIVMSGNWWAP